MITSDLLAFKVTIGNPFEGVGPLGDTSSYPFGGAFGKFETIITTIIGVLTVAAGVWFVFQIFAGAFQWLVSGGEKQALQNAQKRIVNAIVGLAVVVFSYLLIAIVGRIIGFNLLTPASLTIPLKP